LVHDWRSDIAREGEKGKEGKRREKKGKAAAGISPRSSFVILEWGRRGSLISVFFHSGRVWLGPGGRGKAAKNLF